MRFAAFYSLPAALILAQPAVSQTPTAINVQLGNYSFTPKTIVLDHGRSYVLRLANGTNGGHDYTAPAFFAASSIAADDRRLVVEGEVEVPPGQIREIHITAPAAGSYKLKCSHSFHKMLGMSGKILVR
jgi:uncharacterized cupredoxin-like copper-binding protein